MDVKEIPKIILAGHGPDSRGITDRSKCLIPIRGKSSLERTIETLQGMGHTNIFLAGDRHEITAETTIPSSIGIVHIPYSNFLQKFKELQAFFGFGQDARVLLMNGDAPFLNEESITYFIDHVPDADLVMECVAHESLMLFSQYHHQTPMHFRDGRLRVGSLFLVRPARIDFGHLEDILEIRKQDHARNWFPALRRAYHRLGFSAMHALARMYPSHLCYKAGLPRTARALSFVSPRVQDITRHAHKMIGGTVQHVTSVYAENAIDVDFPEDCAMYDAKYDEIQERIAAEHGLLSLLREDSRTGRQLIRKIAKHASPPPELERLPLRDVIKKDFRNFKQLVEIYARENGYSDGND